MPTITDNLNLFKPDAGQSGVAAELNTNWDVLDQRFDEAGGHTHDGTPGQGPKVPVTSLATTGTPSATTYLRGDGLWTTGTGGGGGVTDHGALTGLTDDDHPQYANQSRGDARYVQKANNLSDLANTATARTNIGAAAAVHQHAGADITTGTVPTARLGSGTPSTTTFLRGDQTWAVPGAGGSVNLDDLADVLITSPVENQVLSYDAAGARWINEAAGSGVPTVTTEGDYLAVSAAGAAMWAKAGGSTANRPTGANRLLYHRYFDTTLNKAITFNGTIWVDCTGTSVEAPSIITSGLIFALAMSEGSGQTIAAAHGTSVSAQLGSTSGADANDPDWVTAGLDFNPGSVDVVKTAAFSDTGWLGAVTVMVVCRVDTGGSYRMFVNKESLDMTQNNPLAFGGSPDSTPKLFVARANSNWSGFYGPNVTLGAYRCYSVVTAATVQTAPTFYDGTTASTGTVWNNAATGAPGGANVGVTIGKENAGTAMQMDGVISYVLVYNQALNSTEITQNYNALKAIMAGRGVSLP